jgi:acetolactate synthase-1/3 small subunit
MLAVLNSYEAGTVNANGDRLILEASGDAPTLDTLLAELAPFGIEEVARTGTIAMSCGP